MKITKEELAERLNGREYGREMTLQDNEDAGDSDLYVLFGASDDLIEIRGAKDDEIGTYGSTVLKMASIGPLEEHEECGCDFCSYDKIAAQCIDVKVECCPSDETISWRISTEIPHASFYIYEDGQKYCRGIVIDSDDLPVIDT